MFDRLFAMAVGALLFASPGGATVWNVNPGGTGDAPTIQAAFDAAAPGDTIVLAPGVYRDSHTRTITDWIGDITTTTAIAFMKPGVNIMSSAGADATILDGEVNHHGLVGTDLGTVDVREITFQDCRPSGSGGLGSFTGSGLMIQRSSPMVEGNVFRRCVASGGGGASGLYLIEATGGAVRLNLFVDNVAGDIGGGAGILACIGTVVERNTFVRNLAKDGGGALEINFSQITFSNNVLVMNTANVRGGGLLCLNGSTTAGGCNLFWNNTAPIDDHATQGCLSLFSNNNLVADPLFCDPSADNFHVQSNSPASPDHPSGCGQRGAFGVGCGPISVESASWGRVKAAYR